MGSDLLQDSNEKVEEDYNSEDSDYNQALNKDASTFRNQNQKLNQESSDEDANQKALKYLQSKKKKIDEEEEEDEYSDSFETLPSLEQAAKDQQVIEDLLKTATQEQLDVLKKSLNNFSEARKIINEQDKIFKNAGNLDLNSKVKFIGRNAYEKGVEDDDDYIEEDFEEDNSDSIEDMEDNQDDKEEQLMRERLEQLEKQRKEQIRLANLAKNSQKPQRPISSTINLAANQVTSGLVSNSAKQLYNPKKQQVNQLNVQDVIQAVAEENKNIAKTSRPIASAKVYQPQKVHPMFQAQPTKETQKNQLHQNDDVKKPINTNPFIKSDRPISHVVQKKSTETFQYTPNYAFTGQQETEKFDETNFSRAENNASLAQNFKSSYSTPQQVDVDDVLKKIFNLDDSQRHALFCILKTLDQKGDLSGSKLNEGLSIFLNQNEQVPSKSISSHNEIIIRVLSTLGNPHVSGLTEIEVFDENAKKINVTPSCIMIRNLGKGPKVQVDKLVNGQKFTNDEKQMWLGYLPLPPKNLEIQIRIANEINIGGIKLWNYNKGIFDCTKGIFQFQVFLNDTLSWEGDLEPGRGYTNKDYSKIIILKQNSDPNFKIPFEICVDQPQPLAQDQAKIKQEPQKTDTLSLLKFDRPQAWQEQKKVEVKEEQQLLTQRQQPGLVSIPESAQERLNKYRSELQLKKLEEKKQPIWFGTEEEKSSLTLDKAASNHKRPSEFRKNLEEKASQLRTDNINEAVQQAVMSVNKAVEISNSKQAMKKQPVLVEESLDSLDYFSVTNLGRLQNEKQNSGLQQTRKNNFDAPAALSRPMWGAQKPAEAEPNGLKDNSIAFSNSSRKSNAQGPRLIKSPFLEEFTKPSPQQQKIINQSFEGDILDDIFKQATKSKVKKNNPTIDSNNYNANNKLEKSNKIDKAQIKINQRSETLEVEQSTQDESYFIPTLPIGQTLVFNIEETWGDMNYLGLTGIEIFDIDGNQIQVSEASISAFPPDVNVLPGYGTDPRTVEKLVDGNYFTNDDLHVWLTPFTSGEDHTITIDLGKRTILSMIRIWNYNKSRIHSYRGAKTLSCSFDNKVIFKGEIKKAPGNTNDPEACCEIILFTENETILQRIDKKDWLNQHEIASGFDNTQRISDLPNENGFGERPMTATKKFSSTEIEEIQFQLQQQQSKPKSLFDERPQTSAIVQSARIGEEIVQNNFNAKEIKAEVKTDCRREQIKDKPSRSLRGRTLQINIKESWGDLFYVGLNGLQVLDENGQPIKITVNPEIDSCTGISTYTRVLADPRDMNSIPGHGEDHRTLEKMFNGKDNTTDDRNMWLIPFNKGENHTITIDFGKTRTISGIRIYNYNKSLEDTLRGVKQIIIRVDDKLVTPKKGITVRKAPGFMEPDVDIGQEIKLPFMQGWSTEQIVPIQKAIQNPINFFQEYEPISMPVGYNFRFNLYSTHGDMFYIGLNGIELFDQNGRDLFASLKGQFKVFASPSGVHNLKGMETDIRKVENIVDGQNMTSEDNHIWLSQFKNTKCLASVNASIKDDEQAKIREPNFVIFMFEEPIALSVVRLWNYTKTPQRGVNEFEIEVDGQRVFRGYARRAPDEVGSFSTKVRDWSTTAIFGGEDSFIQKFARQIYYDQNKKQNVILMNERKVMNQQTKSVGRDQNYIFDERQRPQTKAINQRI